MQTETETDMFGGFESKPFTGVTLFSGGGIAEIGLNHLVQVVGAVEIVPAVADHYREVWGDHVINDGVEEVDYKQFRGIDYGHASPSCRHASIANQSGGESDGDTTSGLAIERFLRDARPRVFTLENVRGYRKFDAFKSILNCLEELGYSYKVDILNAADFGTPQTRIRLFIRAWQGGEEVPDIVRTHSKENWNGWYRAIEDLIPGLQESVFADWQLRRLPEYIRESFIKGFPKAFVVNTRELHGGIDSEAMYTVRAEDEPAYTIAGSSSGSRHKAIQGAGRVVSLDCRCLARLQDIPDWYPLTGNSEFDCGIIGNGVPALLMKAVAESVLLPLMKGKNGN